MFSFVAAHREPANLLPGSAINPVPDHPIGRLLKGYRPDLRVDTGGQILCQSSVRYQQSQSVQALVIHYAEEEVESTTYFLFSDVVRVGLLIEISFEHWTTLAPWIDKRRCDILLISMQTDFGVSSSS